MIGDWGSCMGSSANALLVRSTQQRFGAPDDQSYHRKDGQHSDPYSSFEDIADDFAARKHQREWG